MHKLSVFISNFPSFFSSCVLLSHLVTHHDLFSVCSAFFVCATNSQSTNAADAKLGFDDNAEFRQQDIWKYNDRYLRTRAREHKTQNTKHKTQTHNDKPTG
jgi:hypothetical protein